MIKSSEILNALDTALTAPKFHTKNATISALRKATALLGASAPADSEDMPLLARLRNQVEGLAQAKGVALTSPTGKAAVEWVLHSLGKIHESVAPNVTLPSKPDSSWMEKLGVLSESILTGLATKKAPIDEPLPCPPEVIPGFSATPPARSGRHTLGTPANGMGALGRPSTPTTATPTPIASKALPVPAASSITPTAPVFDDGLNELRAFESATELQIQTRLATLSVKERAVFLKRIEHLRQVRDEMARRDQAAKDKAAEPERRKKAAELRALTNAAPNPEERRDLLAALMLADGRTPDQVAVALKFKSAAEVLEHTDPERKVNPLDTARASLKRGIASYHVAQAAGFKSVAELDAALRKDDNGFRGN